MALQSCVRKGGCLYNTFQAIRWVPVVIVMGAAAWGYYAYVYHLSIMAIDNMFQKVVYILVFHILLVLFVISYFKTILTPAAAPPREFYFEGEALEEVDACQDDPRKFQDVLERYVQQRGLTLRVRGFDNSIRYCDKCKCIKPDRSHHCAMCEQCVLKFDHHCPWVNNCVNFKNYKYFLLFLGYGFAFCLWIFFTDIPYFIDFWRSQQFAQTINMQPGNFHIMFLVLISGMFALSLSALFFYHLYLTSKNRSTVESFRAPVIDGRYEKNAFNHGYRNNYREVFGTRWMLWCLPVFTSLGDGVKFEKWTLTKALAAESTSFGKGVGGSIGALRYRLLAQQEDSESPSFDTEMQVLYSDDEDGEVDLNVNVGAAHV